MNKEEFVIRIKDRLTGGSRVNLDADPRVVDTHLTSAFQKVIEWYTEPPRYELIRPITAGSRSFYFFKNSLSRQVQDIRKIYDSVARQNTTLWAESELLGLDGNILNTQGIVFDATYAQYAKQLSTFFGTELNFTELDDRVLVSGVLRGPVATCLYTPRPSTVADVTPPRVQDWIVAYATALCKESIGRVRSKFKGGDLDMDMDGDTLLNEAAGEKRDLEQQLPNLSFRIEL